jgi:DNA-binding XRE family transcriptional regulator
MSQQIESIQTILWRARRLKGLTQSEVARHIGCTQSAVSMWESGRPDALARDKVELLAKFLEVDTGAIAAAVAPAPAAAEAVVLKYCSVAGCLANVPFTVRDAVCLHPRMVLASPGEKTCCTSCGEFMASQCPKPDCGADVAEGAFCPRCGTPYVASPSEAKGAAALRFSDEQRQRIVQLRELTKTIRAS